VGLVEYLQCVQRVAGAVFHIRVAEHGRKADYLNIGALQRHGHCMDIVNPQVRIDNYFVLAISSHAHSPDQISLLVFHLITG
jgi:hypothetical protein